MTPQLDKISDSRVFSIIKLHDGKFNVCEQCDEYFCIELSKDELLQLGEEIKQLATLAEQIKLHGEA